MARLKPALIAFLVISLVFMFVTPTSIPQIPSLPLNYSNGNNLSAISFATDRAREVYDAVSQDSYRSLVASLSDMGPRPYGSQANKNASFWILGRISEFTNGKVIGQVTGNYDNIIAKLPSKLGSSGPSVMIGAHFDSVEGSPGANDDGSGVAGTLELLRVLSKYTWPVDIYFGFWNDEESGLHGSSEIARQFYDDEVDLLIYYNLDMLLMVEPTLPTSKKINIAYANEHGATFHDAQYWAELTKVMGNNFGEIVTNPVPSNELRVWDYSDHASFETAGYKSVVFAHETGGDLDTAYHTSRDTWSNPLYNYEYATKAVASIGASIAFALSRTEGQRFYERYEYYDIAPNDYVELLVEMSISTALGVNVTSDRSGTFRVTIYDPLGQMVASEDLSVVGGMTSSTSLEVGIDGTYKVDVTNTAGAAIDFNVILDYDTDIDGDSQPDSLNWWYNTFSGDGNGGSDNGESDIDLVNSDRDNDTLSDYMEIYIYGTDYNDNDTDDDGIDDAFEIAVGLDPLYPDSNKDPDFDGLTNLQEYLVGTDLFNRDTDSDLIPDGWEVNHGLDPLVDDAMDDPDGDTMENLYEYRAGYDPQVFDGVLLTVIPTTIGTIVTVAITVGWAVRRRFGRKRN